MRIRIVLRGALALVAVAAAAQAGPAGAVQTLGPSGPSHTGTVHRPVLGPSGPSHTGTVHRPVLGPVEELVEPGCRFARVTADVAVAADGVPRGFAAFSGGTCGDVRVIRWFERGASDWTVVDTPWRGDVVAAAADATGTFLLYQAVDGSLWITRRLRSGATEGGRRISAVAAGSAVEGDLVASGGRWWALWSEGLVGDPHGAVGLVQSRTVGSDIAFQRVSYPKAAVDAGPALALRADGGVTMAWSRRAAGRGSAGSELWVGTVEADSRRRARRFELAPGGPGVTNDQADVFVQGRNTYLAWRRNGRIVVADNHGGAYRAISFQTAGRAPSVRASFGRVFVAWTSDAEPSAALMAERVGTSWSETWLSPPTPYDQAVTGMVAAGGRAMAVLRSPTRLYARLQP